MASLLTSTSSISGHSSTNTTRSVNSTETSISAVAESFPTNQRPRWFTPGLATPTYSTESSPTGVASLFCAVPIHAPLALVVALVLDVRAYSTWNTFCPRATILHQPKSTAPLPGPLRNATELIGIANNNSTLRDGTEFLMEVLMDPSKPNRKSNAPIFRVSVLEQFERDGRIGVRIAWRSRGVMAGLFMRVERVQEFLPGEKDPENTIEYACWDTYYGMLASTLRVVLGKSIEKGCCAWLYGLKDFAEAKARRVEEMKGVAVDIHASPDRASISS